MTTGTFELKIILSLHSIKLTEMIFRIQWTNQHAIYMYMFKNYLLYLKFQLQI